MKLRLQFLFPILIALILKSNHSLAQYKYKIEIQMPNAFEGDSLNIDIDNILENKSYTLKIKNGRVTLAGTMKTKYSSAYIYSVKDSNFVDTLIYIGEKPLGLYCLKEDSSKDPFLNSKIINAYFQKEIIELSEKTKKQYQKYLESYEQFKAADSSEKDSLEMIFFDYRKQYRNTILNFLKSNSTSYFALDFFNGYFVKRANYSDSDSLLVFFKNVFPKEFILSKEGEAIEKMLLSIKQVTVGAPAPNFSSINFFGTKSNFEPKNSDNKYYLLQFWASWCVPCIKELPEIKKIRDEYSSRGLNLISISIDIDSSKWRTAVEKHKMDWENFNDLEVSKKYGITSIPELYLVSPDGTIIYNSSQQKDNNNLEKLNELLLKLFL